MTIDLKYLFFHLEFKMHFNLFKFLWPIMILTRKIINVIITNFGNDSAKNQREREEHGPPADPPG